MDWDRLRIFHEVAEAGAFTRAGERLGLSQSAVSRQISALEHSLNATLFHRHARGLVPTEQGSMLFDTVRDVFGKLAVVEARISESQGAPTGDLRISTTITFGSTWLAPRLSGFLDTYEEVRVQLILDERPVDLAMLEADVAIRFLPPDQSDLIQRKLTDFHYHLFAAPQYIEKFGAPRTIAELDQHKVIGYGEGRTAPLVREVNWILEAGLPANAPHRAPALLVNNVHAMMLACESGVGVAALPDYMARSNPRLTMLNLDQPGPTLTAYFVYPKEMRGSRRVAIFRDFLLAKIREWTF